MSNSKSSNDFQVIEWATKELIELIAVPFFFYTCSSSKLLKSRLVLSSIKASSRFLLPMISVRVSKFLNENQINPKPVRPHSRQALRRISV